MELKINKIFSLFGLKIIPIIAKNILIYKLKSFNDY